MSTISPRKKGVIGCLVIVALIAVCLVAWFFPGIPGTRRVPAEIPLGAMLQAQGNALGPDWTLKPAGEIFTDSDFTHGAWSYLTGFEHSDYHYNSVLEFHTFRSPLLARQWLSPSPRAVNVDKDGNPPDRWSYVPPNADRFIIDCTPETVPRFCYVLLVYQEYSLVYSTDLDGAMALEDLQLMLEVTDRFMANFLEDTTLELGRRVIPTLADLGIDP